MKTKLTATNVKTLPVPEGKGEETYWHTALGEMCMVVTSLAGHTTGLMQRRQDRQFQLHYLRIDLKAVRTSSENSFGSSQAAKCPPRWTSLK
jgi:hypothetical protein